MIIDSGHTIHFCFVHAAVTVSFTRHMIFNIFLVLVVLCELINKSLISCQVGSGVKPVSTSLLLSKRLLNGRAALLRPYFAVVTGRTSVLHLA